MNKVSPGSAGGLIKKTTEKILLEKREIIIPERGGLLCRWSGRTKGKKAEDTSTG
jgi:hypothetical protein